MKRPKLVDQVEGALGHIGPASPLEIAHFLHEHPARARKALRRLFDSGRVRRTGYGRYMLAAHPPERLSLHEWVEREIARFLSEKGGQARTREIHEEIWGGDWEGQNRPAMYGIVVKVLATSDRFEQVRHGLWRLRGSF